MDKELIGKIYVFTKSKYYNDWKPHLLKLLTQSRSDIVKTSPIDCIALQLAMMQSISDTEKTIRIQQKEYLMNRHDLNVIYNQRVKKILKDIADGLAWRILGFNRPLMRVLSQNQSPGHLKTEFSKEDKVAVDYVAAGKQVIINDITNILRIGDLTVIDGGYPVIVEIKQSGDRVWTADNYRKLLNSGGDISKQAKKIIEVDDIIQTGIVNLANKRALLNIIDIHIDTYLNEISQIITGCQKNEFCGRFIDRLMYVRAFTINAIINKADALRLPFKFSKNWRYFTSDMSLYIENGEVIRNKIPYSAYPFSNEVVLQLLSGEIILESYINLIELKKRYERFGWKVRLINTDVSLLDVYKTNKQYSGSSLFSVADDDAVMILSKNGFNMPIKIEHIGMIIWDFIKPEINTNVADYYYELTKESRSSAYFSNSYLHERDIWV